MMTFNIRQDANQDGENNWVNRREMAANMVLNHGVAIVGLQEAYHHQVLDMASRLPAYEWIGVGREDGDVLGEFAPIFYHRDSYELLDKGTFWLSETPDVKGSIGWDADCVRIVTWGKFREAGSEDAFYFFNTHFDHLGQRAMVESASLIVARINLLAGNERVILGGDFNFTSESAPYKIIVGNASRNNHTRQLVNAEDIALSGHQGPPFTFHGFSSQAKVLKEIDVPGSEGTFQTIDFLFVDETLEVVHHATLMDNVDGRYPSDHMPVIGDIQKW